MRATKKKCKDCSGRGRWQSQTQYAVGDTELIWFFCDTCRGSGVEQSPEEGEDFDIGGDSYADD